MNIAEFIFTSIRKKLPNINWNLGSALRELIATPLATATEIANSGLNQQAMTMSIDTYVSNPTQYSTEINTLFNSLNLSSETRVEATGTVTIFTTSKQPSPVYQNTVFYYENTPIYVTKDCNPAITPNSDSQFVQMSQVGYNTYSFEVPVSTSGIPLNLTVGTSVIWNEAPEEVYALTVTSPISGGRTKMTLLEKALKIKDYIAPNVVTLNDGITKMLRQLLPNYVVDAAFAQDISAVNKAYLYVKTKKAPGYFKYKTTANRTSSGLYEVDINIPGIINVKEAHIQEQLINIYQLQITNNNVYCMLEFDSNEKIIDVTLTLYGLEDAFIIQDTLNGCFAGSPYAIEVKAPDVFDIGVEFEYSGIDLTISDLSAICETIQNMELNKNISDSYLSTLLSAYGATLEGSAIYSISNIDGLYYKQKISPFIYAKKYSYFAIYAGIDKIKAKHV